MKIHVKAIALSLLGGVVFHADLSLAQLRQPFAYPSRGQSQEQQQKDHFACSSWAKQQTGVDPVRLSTQITTEPSKRRGGLLRGATKGTLLGVVGGAIGGNVGEGAAIGAGVGALAGLMRSGEEQRQASQQANQISAQQQQQLERFYQAWTACMQGRGYTVN